MIRTGDEYRASLQDGRKVYVNGEKVADVTTLCVTADCASFQDPEIKPRLDKFYSLNGDWQSDDRRRLLADARDLIASDHTGHLLDFQMFAQNPRINQLKAVYRNFDWDGPLDFVKKCAGLSDSVWPVSKRPTGDGAVNKWFSAETLPKAAE